MKKIISIIGARPQFIKHAPVQLQLQKKFIALTIHTGQHYDANMSDIFFNELKMPKPEYLLNLKPSSYHGEQTAGIMVEIEKILLSEKPDAVLVYGDTNSTIAGAMVASKLNIPVIHIEAGLRSFNRNMPEEINRVLTDHVSHLLFCPTDSAIENLKAEGITKNVYQTGDVMCDILEAVRPFLKRKCDHKYYFVTLHRPYNVDFEQRMESILKVLNKLSEKVVFSIHPRTVGRLKSFGVDMNSFKNIQFIEPVGYVDSLSYQMHAEAIITDSGGMQKEAYMLKRKCITVRSETEWVETLENGWNELVFENVTDINKSIQRQPGEYKVGLYGDGKASEDIVAIIEKSI